MKRKEELYPVQVKGQVQDKMVKCYECDGEGFEMKDVPNHEGLGGIVFFYSPVTCKSCQGWGQVPMSAQEQLSTIAPGCTEGYCIHASPMRL